MRYQVSGSQAFRVLDQLGATSKQRYVPALSFAVVYVGLGENEQAFLWLEKAYVERTNSLAYLKSGRHLGPLRSDPRFADWCVASGSHRKDRSAKTTPFRQGVKEESQTRRVSDCIKSCEQSLEGTVLRQD